jgi:peptidoglycan/LPS O-acetylase OafA/YrhL
MNRLAGLDALRGLAALSVLLWHLPQFGGYAIIGHGYLAVDFFFMLSGYVMARTYENRMAEMGAGVFLLKRLWRLWPLMAVGTLIGLATVPGLPIAQQVLLVACGLLFLPIFASGEAYPLNGPSWSIFFELFANALHAFVLYRLRTTSLLGIAGVTLIVLCGVALRDGSLNGGFRADNFVVGFPRVVFAYCLGICLYRKWRDRPPVILPAWLTLGLLPATLVLAGLDGGWWFDILFLAFTSPMLIAGGLSLCGGKVGACLGALSFPLYAVHRPILQLCANLGASWLIGALCGLGAAAAITMLASRRDQSKSSAIA